MDRRAVLQSLVAATAVAGAPSHATIRVPSGELFVAGASVDQPNHPLDPFRAGFVKVSSRETGYAWAMFEPHVPPGSGVPLHVHHHQEEWFYVLDGEFLIEVGGKQQRMTTGMGILGPRMVPHRFKNSGESPGRLLVLAQPAGLLEQSFEEIFQLPVGEQHDTAILKKLLAKYDIEVIGPPLP